MDENLEETVSADLNSSQLVLENVRNDKAKKARVYGVGNQGRCAKQRTKKNYPKKRKYHPPKNEKSAEVGAATATSTSQTKVVDVDISSDSEHSKPVEGYRLFDLNMLSTLVADLLCPNCCDKQLYISENASKRKGLASFISVKCTCGFSKSEYTSPCVQKEGKGVKAFDINIRSVYAMRSCGLGYSVLEKFCGLMNIPPPVTKNNYSTIANKLRDSARTVATDSMSASAEEAKQNEATSDISVSVDGTWQKRGFSSMNGVVVAVSTTNIKVLDVEIMSRNCKACASKDDLRKSNKIEFDKWKILHEPSCKANHEGSAGSMEVVGALRIFQRSVEKYGARYINYYGDGDSKSYDVVKNVYPGMTVEKYECIGHYQKRVGNRLRKLRARTKGLGGKNKKIPKKDGDKSKVIKAKSRLTDTIIDKLQNYLGIALRSNIGNL